MQRSKFVVGEREGERKAPFAEGEGKRGGQEQAGKRGEKNTKGGLYIEIEREGMSNKENRRGRKRGGWKIVI